MAEALKTKPGFLHCFPPELHGFFEENPTFFEGLAFCVDQINDRLRGGIWDKCKTVKLEDESRGKSDRISTKSEFRKLMLGLIVVYLAKKFHRDMPISNKQINLIAAELGSYFEKRCNNTLMRDDWCKPDFVSSLILGFIESEIDGASDGLVKSDPDGAVVATDETEVRTDESEMKTESDGIGKTIEQPTSERAVITDEKESELTEPEVKTESSWEDEITLAALHIADWPSEVGWIFEKYPLFLEDFALFFRSSSTLTKKKIWWESAIVRKDSERPDTAPDIEMYESLMINSLTRYVSKHHAKFTSPSITAADIALIAGLIACYFQVKCMDGLRQEDWCKRTFCFTLITKLSYGANRPWFLDRMPTETHWLFHKLPTVIEDTADFIRTLAQRAREDIWNHSVNVKGLDRRKYPKDVTDRLKDMEYLMVDSIIVSLKYFFPRETPFKFEQILPVAKPLALFVQRSCDGLLKKEDYCDGTYIASILIKWVNMDGHESDELNMISLEWSWVFEKYPFFIEDFAEFIGDQSLIIKETMWEKSVGLEKLSANVEQSYSLIRVILQFFIENKHSKDKRLHNKDVVHGIADPITAFVLDQCDGTLTFGKWCGSGCVAPLMEGFTLIPKSHRVSQTDHSDGTRVVSTILRENPSFWDGLAEFIDECGMGMKKEIWDAVMTDLEVIETREQLGGLLHGFISRFNPSLSIDDTSVLMRPLLTWIMDHGSLTMADFIEKDRLSSLITEYQLLNDVDQLSKVFSFDDYFAMPKQVKWIFLERPIFIQDIGTFLYQLPQRSKVKIWDHATPIKNPDGSRTAVSVANTQRQFTQMMMDILQVYLKILYKNQPCPVTRHDSLLISESVVQFIRLKCRDNLTRDDFFDQNKLSDWLFELSNKFGPFY